MSPFSWPHESQSQCQGQARGHKLGGIFLGIERCDWRGGGRGGGGGGGEGRRGGRQGRGAEVGCCPSVPPARDFFRQKATEAICSLGNRCSPRCSQGLLPRGGLRAALSYKGHTAWSMKPGLLGAPHCGPQAAAARPPQDPVPVPGPSMKLIVGIGG